MYAVITCSHCRQTVQVAQTALGKLVKCPLCNQATLAEAKPSLPIAEPLPEAGPIEQPLSLDDAEQLSERGMRNAERGIERSATTTPRARANEGITRRTVVYAVGSIVLAALAVAAVYVYFRYGSGEIPDSAWREFRPPAGRCIAMFPGEPEEEAIAAQTYASVGGKRFTKRRWFEQVTLSLAWIDYDPEKFKNTTFEQAYLAELDLEAKRLNATVSLDNAVNFVARSKRYEGRTIQYHSKDGIVVQRMLMEKGVARPRLYILTISGKKIVPGGHMVDRFIERGFVPED